MELSLKLPAVIGRYVLEGQVASGGMATVYHGRASGAAGYQRTVAIKRMHPHCANDPEFVAMFLDEANLAARIRHPNVVSVLDIVSEGDSLIMVMEYVAGDTVDRLLRSARESGKRPPHRVVAAIVAGALQGLHAAHQALSDDGQPLNIVHRDVSPQNIIVGFDGVARLLDFGVAKARVRLQTTRAGQIKGRLQYMAPEQIRNKPVDRRADVYATSVVMWEMLAGRRLFEADNEGAMMIMVLEGTVPSLRAVDPTISPALEAVLLKGLRPSPSDRFSTAQEMVAAIDGAVGIATASEVAAWVRTVVPEAAAQRAARIAGLDLDSFGPAPIIPAKAEKAPRSPAPERQPRPKSKKPLLFTAFGVTLVLFIVAFWIALRQIPWLGPTLIDTSRAVFGDRITAWIERTAITADAGWRKLWNEEERPEAHWNLPATSASAAASGAPALEFRLPDLQPMNSAPFAKHDGAWIPTEPPAVPRAPHAYRMELHPDVDRPDTVVRIVAFDRRRTIVELVLGAARRVDGDAVGLVAHEKTEPVMAIVVPPPESLGVSLDGVQVAPSKAGSCMVGYGKDGAVRIGPWESLRDNGLKWWREATQCLVIRGAEESGLPDAEGARRVALGTSADGAVLFIAAGKLLSSATLARGIKYAGAWNAVQIGDSDTVSNVTFVIPIGDTLDTTGLLASAEGELVGLQTASPSDFFVVRKIE